jgi:hypothetical protein
MKVTRPVDPQIRRNFVNEAYPRMLYMCSSVYIFTFSAAVAQQQNWLGMKNNIEYEALHLRGTKE